MINNEAVKPCEVAAAIRKIDVRQYYECVAKEIEQLRAEVERDEALLRQALGALAYWLEVGETPGSHDIIQRTHDVLPERAVKPPPLGGGYKAHLAYARKICHNFNYGNLN